MTRKLYTSFMKNPNTSEANDSCSGQISLKDQYKFNGWLAATTVVYLVSLFLNLHYPNWSPGLKITISLAPVLPGLLYLKNGLKLLDAMDELQRRIQLEAWLFALIGTVIISTVLNVLNAHGISWETFPHGLEIGGTYLVMYFLWCIGIAVSTRRFQ